MSIININDYSEEELEKVLEENEEKGNHNLICSCSCCGAEGIYLMDEDESKNLERYWVYGRQVGFLQDIFPNVPAWVRSGAIDKFADGFCICPDCCK